MEYRSRSKEPFRLPRVTVLMAVFNGAAYLRQAVESILAQTFGDFEFLVINDGSTDQSRAIIASYDDPRIRILDNPENIGLTRSLNRGLAEAHGELIARQDADDVSHVSRLLKQVAFMDAEPEVVALGTQARFVNAIGKAVSAYGWDKLESSLGLRWQIMFDSAFVHTSVVFRRSVVWGVERGYDENFATSQDFELWSRLLRRHKLRNLPDVLVDLRQHANSVSARKTEDKVAKVRSVLQANLQMNVPDYPAVDQWLDLWIALNNQRVSAFRDSIATVLQHLLRIRAMYLARYGRSIDKPEIDWHTAALLLRGAFATVEAGLPGAARLAREALRYNVALTFAAAPKLTGHLLRRSIFR